MRFASRSSVACALLIFGQIALTSGAAAQCPSCVGDADADGSVTIDEIITAVNNALHGCNRPPTPAVTSTPTPQATPIATQPSACAVTPGAWAAPEWTANASEALALRAQLNELTGNATMRGAEQGTVVLGGVAHLSELYHTGTPSLADVTTPAFDPIVDEAFVEFVALINAGTGDPISDSGTWAPGPSGGIFGNSSRGMNAGGLELRQIVEKGLFSGAAFYRYALGLTEGTIDAATIDALAAAWGANELLDPAGALVHSANYSRLMGFHAEMASALTRAKAFASSAVCGAERDAAVTEFFRLWEHSMLARVVFYANRGLTLAAMPADNDKVEGLHQIAEGAGLLLGFGGMPSPQSGPLAGAALTIDDDSIDAIATAFGIDTSDLNASTTGALIDDLDAFAAAVLAVEQVVAEVYELDAAEIASYRDPVAG